VYETSTSNENEPYRFPWHSTKSRTMTEIMAEIYDATNRKVTADIIFEPK